MAETFQSMPQGHPKPSRYALQGAAQFPSRLRLQEYSDQFAEYDLPNPRNIPQPIKEGKIILGIVMLRKAPKDFLFPIDITESTKSDFNYYPRSIWFSIRRTAQLIRLMIAVAEWMEIEPPCLFFYHRGLQINPLSTAAQLRLQSGDRLDVEVDKDEHRRIYGGRIAASSQEEV